MSTTPETRRGKLAFYEAHLQAWADHAAAIGLSAEQVAGLESRIETARSALLASEVARDAARAATLTFHETADDLAGFGSGLIGFIRGTAETASGGDDPTGDQIYALAQIPPRRRPGPTPAPGRPYAPEVGLLATGALELTWQCDNPRGIGGTMYEIHRSLAAPGGGGPGGGTGGGTGGTVPGRAFEFLGIAGTRRYEDATLPAGTGSAVYRITAVRSTRRGYPADFIVNLGVPGMAGAAGAGARASGYRLAG